MKQFILLCVFCLACCTIHGQVTIGSNIKPVDGALLDLKEKDSQPDNTTAVRGLLLPRVNLSVPDHLYPMFENTASPGQPNSDYNNATKKAGQDVSHVGLVVYNLMDNAFFCPGIYAWNGDLWERLMEPCCPRVLSKSAGASLCGSGTTTLAAEASLGAVIRWYDAATGGTLLQTSTGQTGTYTTPNLTQTTSYWVEAYSATNECLQPRQQIVVTVNPLPAAPTGASQQTAICTSGSTTLSATVPAGCTIDWYAAATGGTPLPGGTGTTTYTTPTLNATTKYYAEARDLTGCKSANRLEVTATVTPQPSLTIPNGTNLSFNGTAFARAEVTPGTNTNIRWYDVPVGGQPIGNGAIYNVAPSCASRKVYAEAWNDCGVKTPRTEFTVPGYQDVSWTATATWEATQITLSVTLNATPTSWYLDESEGPGGCVISSSASGNTFTMVLVRLEAESAASSQSLASFVFNYNNEGKVSGTLCNSINIGVLRDAPSGGSWSYNRTTSAYWQDSSNVEWTRWASCRPGTNTPHSPSGVTGNSVTFSR